MTKARLALAVRSHLPAILFVVAAIAAFVIILYLGRSLTFYNDEWTFIQDRRNLTLDNLLRPHNEHWSFFLVAWFVGLFGLVGMGSYIPYLASLLAVHVVCAGAVYRLVSTVAGHWTGLAASVLALFLGAGYQNLFWAFQIGFVGSAATGLWALDFLVRRGNHATLIAGLLLTFAVSTSGIGLSFVVAAAVLVVADGTWRSRWLAIALPLVTYAVWFATVGRTAVGVHRDPFSPTSIAQLPAYVLRGVEHVIGTGSGWGDDVGRIIVVLAAAAVLRAIATGRRIPPVAVAAMAGVVSEYAVIGLVRAQFGVDQATEARYLYSAAMLILVGAAAALGAITRSRRPAQLVVLAPLLAVALVANLNALWQGRAEFQARADYARALVTVAEELAATPAIKHSDGVFPLPPPRSLVGLVEQYGSPTRDRWWPGVVKAVSPERYDLALFELTGQQLTLVPATPADRGSPPVVIEHADSAMNEVDGCLRLMVTGPDPRITLSVPPNNSIYLSSAGAGVVQVFLALRAGPQEAASTRFVVEAGTTYLLTLPQIDAEWTVRIDPASVLPESSICALRATH